MPIPKGVTVTVEASTVRVKGPRGELMRVVHRDMAVAVEDAQVVVTRPSDEPEHKALHGLTRTLVANMVEGVTAGFKKQLEIMGVGYKAETRPFGLQLALGLLASRRLPRAGGHQALGAAAHGDRDRGGEQGSGGTGRGGAAEPASAGAVQGEGHQVRR